jgi:drug/metabolite transporter (DMT)-like permease
MKARLSLLAIAILWGISFSIVKDALSSISPLAFNFLRMLIAAVILLALNWSRVNRISRRNLFAASLVGLFLSLGYQLQTLGLARTTPTKSALITGLVVVFVPCITIVRRLRPANAPRPGPAVFAGALVALAGLLLLTTPSGTRLSRLFSTIGTGDWLTLACAVAFSAHLLTMSHVADYVPARQLATVQITLTAIVTVLTLPLGGPVTLTIPHRIVPALLITGILCTVVAFSVQSWAQQHVPPVQTALLLTLEPVFAWLTSVFWFHEHLTVRSLCGAALILAAAIAVQLASGDWVGVEIPA